MRQIELVRCRFLDCLGDAADQVSEWQRVELHRRKAEPRDLIEAVSGGDGGDLALFSVEGSRFPLRGMGLGDADPIELIARRFRLEQSPAAAECLIVRMGGDHSHSHRFAWGIKSLRLPVPSGRIFFFKKGGRLIFVLALYKSSDEHTK